MLSWPLLLVVRGVWAQSPSDLAVRRTLLDEAQQAAADGNTARALELGVRAGEIQWTPSLHAFVAGQHLALRHAVDALGMADLCLREVDRDRALPNRDRVQQECLRVATEARAVVGYVTVQTSSETPAGLTFVLAGRSFDARMAGMRIPVDPGDVAVEATLPDGRRDTRAAHVEPGAAVVLSLFPDGLPPLAPTPVPSPPPAEVAALLPPARVELRVVPSVATADVVIDGLFAGSGAVLGRVEPGVHQVEVRAPGYVRWSQAVPGESGLRRSMSVTLVATARPVASSRPAWVLPVAITAGVAGAAALAGGLGGWAA